MLKVRRNRILIFLFLFNVANICALPQIYRAKTYKMLVTVSETQKIKCPALLI